MSTEAIQAFKDQINSNEEFAARVRAEGTSPEALVKIAEDAGHRFTTEELAQAATAGELNEQDLDQVTGGARTRGGLSEAPFQIFIDYLFWQKR